MPCHQHSFDGRSNIADFARMYLTAGRARGIDRLPAKAPALSASPSFFTLIRRSAGTLALAAAGGVALGLTGVPGGYLSGAILSVAAAALAGRPMLVPVPLMRTIFGLLRRSA